MDLDELAAACGVATPQLRKLAALLGGGRRWLSFYCMGLGQSAVGMWKINSLINLHLLTGAIGRPGCGPFSLTGQPNAMGGREIGLLSHQLPGLSLHGESPTPRRGRSVLATSARLDLLAAGTHGGRDVSALERGQLKAVWIAATNPMVSLPDLHHVRRGLDRAELVIVQDAFHPTETSQMADVVLPAASWGEREWTSTNSDRTVAYSEKLVDPPGARCPIGGFSATWPGGWASRDSTSTAPARCGTNGSA